LIGCRDGHQIFRALLTSCAVVTDIGVLALNQMPAATVVSRTD